jgi:hypothetical protein
MKLSKTLPALMLAAFLPLVASAGNEAILGSWTCTAETPEGEMPSTWVIKEDGGALAVEIDLHGAKQPASVVGLEGQKLSLKIDFQGAVYDLVVTFTGDTFEGTWAGSGSQGTLKGKRAESKTNP